MTATGFGSSIDHYVNPNTRGLTSNRKNTAIKDEAAFRAAMPHLLNPIEDMVQVLKTPIKLADCSLLDRKKNSIDIASGLRISVNGGHVLTVKPQGVEVSGGDNPYDTESYVKAQRMADALSTMLRNACGTMKTVAHSKEEYDRYTQGVTDVMSYLGIDTSRSFTVNGMKFHKDENGFYESEANSQIREAYERLKSDNRTYRRADERTRKQIDYITDYYLETVPEDVKTAWQETMKETDFNPFWIDVGSTLTQLSMEQDFQTGGNDNLFGSTVQSCRLAVGRILNRIGNPLGIVTEKRAVYLEREKKFYSYLASKLGAL